MADSPGRLEPDMATGTLTVHLEMKVSWWVRRYIASLALFAYTFGTQPDIDKARKIIERGIKVRIA
jgi:hypothetical protein